MGIALFGGCKRSEEFVIPNERAVETEMLVQKFAGAKYFQQSPDNPKREDRTEIFISVHSAEEQAKGIIQERHFSPEIALKLFHLIEMLTEPAPSRLFSDRVNLVRLNLALDELR